MSRIKNYIVLVLFSLLVVSNSACTKENDKKIQKNTEAVSSVQPASSTSEEGPGVFDIESISKAEKGKAVDFTWTENGKKRSFSELTKGKVVLLNFWATWCPPCRMEIPDIISIDKEKSGKDFIVVGISLDNRGTLDEVRKLVKGFVKNKKISYINFLATQDIAAPYGGISGIPTSFFIDKKGNIVDSFVGMRDKAGFLEYIKRAMK